MGRVLVACEFSGTVRRAFRDAGHDAWSCDLLAAEDGSEFHIHDDVTAHLREPWDLVIAHPPCTYLANCGVWARVQRKEWVEIAKGANFFLRCFEANSDRVAVENPVMARKYTGIRKPDFTVQPWQFGHGESKRTCFWVRGLPALRPTEIVEGREQRVLLMAPSPERQKERSRFFSGIARAMADQWGPLLP